MNSYDCVGFDRLWAPGYSTYTIWSMYTCNFYIVFIYIPGDEPTCDRCIGHSKKEPLEQSHGIKQILYIQELEYPQCF